MRLLHQSNPFQNVDFSGVTAWLLLSLHKKGKLAVLQCVAYTIA